MERRLKMPVVAKCDLKLKYTYSPHNRQFYTIAFPLVSMGIKQVATKEASINAPDA